MISTGPTVAAIIPMYNAARTIDQTLASVCRQTYANLDIVVVDDGCRDDSCDIVERRAASDQRIRLIHQANAGVAAARNTGAAQTRAPFLAFVDADDLWAPEKVELQLAALMARPAPTVAYCYYAQIDASSRVLWLSQDVGIEGNVLRALCRMNFVGNGSSMMMPRAVFDYVGGFDPSLREARAQGCEDLMFLLQAAERFSFVCVRRHLVGYRLTHDNMSSDVMQMVRSCELVTGHFSSKYPNYVAELDAQLKDLIAWLCDRALIAGRVGTGLRVLHRLYRTDRGMVNERLGDLLRSYFRARVVPQWAKRGLRPFIAKIQPPRAAYIEQRW